MTKSVKIWVSAKIEKELAEEFKRVAEALGTDRSKLIRNLMEDAVDEYNQGSLRRQKINRTLRTNKATQ